MKNLGIDYLLAAGNTHVNYIDLMCKYHPKNFGAGFLFKASGLNHGSIAACYLAATGKLDNSFCRCHGLWHDSHRFTARHIKPAVRQAKILAELVEQYPAINWMYSPWLEPGSHQNPIPTKLMNQCLKECSKVLPREVKLVSGVFNPRRLTEVHGTDFLSSSSYIYSFDGTDMLNQQAAKALLSLHTGANYKMGWTARCNLKAFAADNTSRQNRKVWLRERDIKKMERLLRRYG